MAKRTTNHKPDHVPFAASGGFYVSIGKKMQPDGTLKKEVFYFGKDIPMSEAIRRKALVKLEWAKLKANRVAYWTSEAYQSLHKQGVITDKRATADVPQVLALYPDPLNDADLAPFLDDKGMIRREAAIAAIHTDAQNVLARTDVRSKFHADFLKGMLTDPIQTLEQFKRLFDLPGKDVHSFMFSFAGGGVNANPIAFDASDTVDATKTVTTAATVKPAPAPPVEVDDGGEDAD